MTKLKTLAIATITLAFACGASTAAPINHVEQISAQAKNTQSVPLTRILDGEFRLSQTATCIHNGKRYNKGARICMGGVYQYCNSRGLWEPSNLSC